MASNATKETIRPRVEEYQQTLNRKAKEQRLAPEPTGLIDDLTRRPATDYLITYERIQMGWVEADDGLIVPGSNEPQPHQVIESARDFLVPLDREDGKDVPFIDQVAAVDACSDAVIEHHLAPSQKSVVRKQALHLGKYLQPPKADAQDMIIRVLAGEQILTKDTVLPVSFLNKRGGFTKRGRGLLREHLQHLQHSTLDTPPAGANLQAFSEHSLVRAQSLHELRQCRKLIKQTRGLRQMNLALQPRQAKNVSDQLNTILDRSPLFNQRLRTLNNRFTEGVHGAVHNTEILPQAQKDAFEVVKLLPIKKYAEQQLAKELSPKIWRATKERVARTNKRFGPESRIQWEQQIQEIRQKIEELIELTENPHELDHVGFYLKHLTDPQAETRRDAMRWLVEFKTQKLAEIKKKADEKREEFRKKQTQTKKSRKIQTHYAERMSEVIEQKKKDAIQIRQKHARRKQEVISEKATAVLTPAKKRATDAGSKAKAAYLEASRRADRKLEQAVDTALEKRPWFRRIIRWLDGENSQQIEPDEVYDPQGELDVLQATMQTTPAEQPFQSHTEEAPSPPLETLLDTYQRAILAEADAMLQDASGLLSPTELGRLLDLTQELRANKKTLDPSIKIRHLIKEINTELKRIRSLQEKALNETYTAVGITPDTLAAIEGTDNEVILQQALDEYQVENDPAKKQHWLEVIKETIKSVDHNG